MIFIDPLLVLMVLAGVVSLLLFAVILRTLALNSTLIVLQAFLIVSAAWAAVETLLHLIRMNQLIGLDRYALERTNLYLVFALGLLFYQLTRIFTRRPGRGLAGWLGGTAFLAAGILLYENPLNLPDLLAQAGGLAAARISLAYAVLLAGWGLLMGAAVLVTLHAHQRAASPLHKNRVRFWAVAAALAAAGQGLLLGRAPVPGAVFHLASVLCAAFVLLTYHLPDLRLAARKFGAYLSAAVVAVAVYAAAFVLAINALRDLPGATPLLIGLGVGVVISFLINPLLRATERFFHHLILGLPFDASRTLSEYSQRISNILDLERLAAVVVDLIGEEMQITHGALITVTYDASDQPGDDSSSVYILTPIDSQGKALPEIWLAARNPVAYTLSHERQPLTQYDIDVLPRFREIGVAERAWIDSLNMDVYVPIYAQNAWIGAIALGPKKSGDRYFDEDLLLLKTLADQTAVALQNARLVQDLKERNRENERLNRDLSSANQELARLDQAKSDFINIASHELRTPLTQVIGYNDILHDMLKTPGFQPETGAQMVSSVRKAARRLEEIVETMFDVSKLDTHTLDLERSPVTLASVVAGAVDNWQEGLEQRSLTLSVRGLAKLPPVMADGKRLGQVFSNLIQNAMKSTPDGGQIRVEGRLLADEASRQQFVEVTVADNGIGIAAEDLERIFEKFYRVGSVLLHSTGDTKFKGAGPGLGLTIARGIVDAHGGRIWAESPGYDETACPGAVFHVLLPCGPIEDAYADAK